MPTSMFHLNVSNKIAKKYPKYDNSNFYIGTIAPDAVNVNGFAEKSIRWSAHKRAKDLDEWKANIINFYKNEVDKNDKSYLLGYVIHVLTDIIADELYYKEGLFEDIVKNRTSEDLAFGFFKDQIRAYERSQLNSDWWNDVKSKLEKSQAFEINEISKEMIEDWKNKVLEDYENQVLENYDYVTPNMVEICADRALKILKENEIEL